MTRCLPAIAAALLLLGFGVAEGKWTNRWHQSHAAEDAGRRLAEIPLTLGEWQGTSGELDPRQAVKAELSGSILRQYTHKSNGTTLTVLLVCGRPGPVSVHTPDVCFAGSGFTM